MTKTLNVNVTYSLSTAGQKAAILAGRDARSTVTETMTFEDPALVAQLEISSDGTLKLDVTKYVSSSIYEWMYLDAPPASLEDLLAVWSAFKARLDAKKAEQEAAMRERVAVAAKELADKEAKDAPEVDALLDKLEAAGPEAAIPDGVTANYYGLGITNYSYSLTGAQQDRLRAYLETRQEAVRAKEKAEGDAKEAARQAKIAEHGGHYWELDGSGMCNFADYGLWSLGQSRRWVGIFTQPKGVDSFLASPKGEFSFNVNPLKRGDCIQGAGFDTSSRGKRRRESEFFAVVLRRDDQALVIEIVGSRAAALKAAAKLAKEGK